MILSDQTLERLIKEKIIVIDPVDEKSIQPASVDLRLGTHFLIIEENQMEVITLDSEVQYRETNSDTIIIPPKSFLLATTQEYIKLPNDITAFVEGRSSIGRIGLFIQNAGWVDPGFEGRITLELYNASALPIKLQAGKRICQLVCCRMDAPAKTPYNGKYQGQDKTTGSKIHKDTDTIKINL
ncbi:dCTP deaminase [Candidatus Peregrinibacteria bacterium CG_4_10_14_0_2_um_filter_38_24]|nr:MAG: dCTP deaminase [Candidatus Peregrinibacteria bacterium CG_4_10_14_0_2_um_filter_38_24]